MMRLGPYNIQTIEDIRQMVYELTLFSDDLSRGLELQNVKEPPTPKNGGVLFIQDGELKYKGSNGTITTLAVA
jgi:hypothetical protein